MTRKLPPQWAPEYLTPDECGRLIEAFVPDGKPPSEKAGREFLQWCDGILQDAELVQGALRGEAVFTEFTQDGKGTVSSIVRYGPADDEGEEE